ncbi:MAG: hypothetical protein MUP55_00745 [Candidatus Aenigmarchaeota archaeon]|nr:hypothetical protein [Candidatus Aenigmarchaeota archaeon]
MKYIQGYEGKEIVDATTVDVDKLLKEGTDKDIIVAYAKLSEASHHRKNEKQGKLAWEKSKKLVDEVRIRLEKVGWHAHIFATGSCECKCDRDLYLHMFAGMPCVREVPFSEETNEELTEHELFDGSGGKLRTMNESLELMKARIGKDSLDLASLVEDGELEEDDAKTIMAIMKEQGLTEVHEVGERTFRSGTKEYTWMDSKEDAEQLAREHLEDGGDEQWKMAVQAGNTTEGLDDWIETVLDSDGWEGELCSYDGCSYELPDGKVYWRSN